MTEKKYYSIEEAAAYLGLTPAEINLRRERNELHGYRDGVNWKFKAEDVEALALRLRSQAISAAGDDDDTGEVLLSEVALGGSDAGTSGTVIGGKGKAKPDSDLRLVDSGVKLDEPAPKPGGSGLDLAEPAGAAAGASTGSQELDMTIDEDLLEDELEEKKAAPAKKPGDSAVDVGSPKLADDELVIGGSGSGTGSDITIGGDSGISLVDPTDSGLSLEEPLELERQPDDDSLELGEDDMLTFSEEADAEAPTALKAEDEFQLTPLEEAAEEESESGSQVIALDSAAVSGEAPTMIAAAPAPMGPPMLESEDVEEFGPPQGFGPAVPAAVGVGAAQPAYEGAGAAAPALVLPEAPYSGLQITALVATVVLLILCGWMGFDLLRNMWSWNGEYPVNSALMDMILGLFG